MLLTEVPRAITRHLAAQPFFQQPVQIPVRAMCEQDIVDWSASKMASLGMHVQVMSTRGKAKGEASPGCVRMDTTLLVRVRENLLMNRSASGTGVAAESVAEAAAAFLQGHYPLDEAGARLTNANLLTVVDLAQADDPDGLLCWECILSSTGMLKADEFTQALQQEPLKVFEPIAA